MLYSSTRNREKTRTAAQAIVQGLAEDGGLFTPLSIPALPQGKLAALTALTYQQRAAYVMGLYLEEFSQEELMAFATAAYGRDRFDTDAVAPVVSLSDNTHCLELWHGPTCAFKDMALQMLPHLLTASLKKTGEEKTACILVATSGDTGKGALEGFRDVAGTRILVFYPKDGVSEVQETQMVTQEGDNVGVCAIYGNFDDAQTGVKHIFSDTDLAKKLEERGFFFSSANSINWGRVLPQVCYYVSAYCDLVRDGKIEMGTEVNVCVPTGNFGNILAAYYAKAMGVPLGKFICASNSNNVLTEFIRTGIYDRNRQFHNTMSPSMDILISSNLERLLLALSDDDQLVKGYMTQLNETGCYEISAELKAKLQDSFAGYYCDDATTQEEIGTFHKHYDYLMDPHTAVGFHAIRKYREDTKDLRHAIIASTASPFKFCDSVLGALDVVDQKAGLDILDQLTEVSGLATPAPLASLRGKAVRFTQVVEKDNMVEAVLGMLE